MVADSSFEETLRRVRAGDPEAAAILVRRYEPVLRRLVRVRLADARLRRLLDSADICQSVLASFFVRAGLGQYELETPDQLVRLLTIMARNKLADQVDRARAQRRGGGGHAVSAAHVPTTESGPVQTAITRELLHEAHRRLSSEERRWLELRQEGRDWAAIAAEAGLSAEAVRKRLARAIDRVTQELGLEETRHE